jgi:hypothetical protein
MGRHNNLLNLEEFFQAHFDHVQKRHDADAQSTKDCHQIEALSL